LEISSALAVFCSTLNDRALARREALGVQLRLLYMHAHRLRSYKLPTSGSANGAPFGALFLADKDRLGREQFETNHILKQISVAGVRIFEYQNGGHEVRLDSPIDKLIMSVSNFAAELERAKASQRTRDALHRKAQRGFVAGGAVFGYRNVPVLSEDGRRSHVIREVHHDEAATVHRIFSMAAHGVGFRTIAQTLNAEGLRSPRARAGRHHSWSPSSIRTVLFNALYKGEVIWGRTKKRDAWGRRKESDRPAAEWTVTQVEHLRIVNDDLWTSAHQALSSKQKTFGFKRGTPRPAGAFDSKHLLTGFVQCGVCGGTIVQTWNGKKPAYRCWYNHSRGRAVCSNSLVVDMRLADDAVLRAITRDVLDSEVVREALDLALRDMEQPDLAVAAHLETLKNELGRLDAELVRYAEAIAASGPLDVILQAIKVREQRRGVIRTKLKTLGAQRPFEAQNTSQIRTVLSGYLEDWRAMARQGIGEARGLLRAVLVNRLVFTPVPRPTDLPPRKGPGRKAQLIYELRGEGSLSKLFAGSISASSVVAPTGFEPVFKSRLSTDIEVLNKTRRQLHCGTPRFEPAARRCVTRSNTSASLIAHHPAPIAHRSVTTMANAVSIAVGDIWLNAGTRAKTAHEVTKRTRPKIEAVRRHRLIGVRIMSAAGAKRI
jgi:DNA invertase Pin-like site-specific DNA recombinase